METRPTMTDNAKDEILMEGEISSSLYRVELMINSHYRLAGCLLKKGSRSWHSWHDRYFVFQSNNALLYFTDKSSKKQRGVFDLSNCQVSDLFAAEHRSQLIYCVRLTFGDSLNLAVTETSQTLDDSSLDGDTTEVGEDSIALTGLRTNENLSPTRASINRKRLKSELQGRHVTEAGTGPLGSSHRNLDRKPQHKVRPASELDRVLPSHSEDNEKLGIPSLVEFEHQMQNKNDKEGTSPRARTPYEEMLEEEQEFLRTQYLAEREHAKKKSMQKIVKRTQLAAAAGATVGLAVVTAGVGLIAGLILVGAAAASGGTATVSSIGKRGESIVLASVDYDIIKKWKACFDAAVQSQKVERSTWGQLFATEKGTHRHALFTPSTFAHPSTSRPFQKSYQRQQRETKWIPLTGGWVSFIGSSFHGTRIYREDRANNELSLTPGCRVSVDGKPCPPVKAHIVLNASALDGFLCLMSYGCVSCNYGSFPSPESARGFAFRVLETIDDNTDIIHLVLRPLFLFPVWTSPRDFVLYRYWRYEADGSFIICYESIEHDECPPHPLYVRGEMHNCFTVSPQKKSYRRRTPTANANECLMTAVTQVDPKGWVPTTPLSFLSSQSYADAFGIAILIHLTEIRDAIDLDRFVPISMCHGQSKDAFHADSSSVILKARSYDSTEEVAAYDESYDFAYASREYSASKSISHFARIPPPLDMTMWASPDSNSFLVRGPNYLDDRKKINAGRSIGKLVAVDLVSVDEPVYGGFATLPTERIQLALEEEANLRSRGQSSDMAPFVFVVNICIPGPPFYHALFYFAVDDRSKIDGTDGSPSSRLCEQFFFGDSDDFRNRTFKLIPQIVQGNFIVRKAVGSTPAVLGKKLRQFYVRNDRFFEVIIDCGSSSVATGVIRLSLGYAKTLVIDMGFVLEGNDESMLPERIFGCVRMKNIDFSSPLRHVSVPEDEDE